MKKTFKLLITFSLIMSFFVGSLPIHAAEKDTVIEPLVAVVEKNAFKDGTFSSTTIDPGNTLSFYVCCEGTYVVTNQNGFNSVSNVNVYFNPVKVSINGKPTSLVFGRISNINRTNNSTNVSITFTIQYRESGSSVWNNLRTVTWTV